MDTITRKIKNLDINNPYILTTPPPILSSTNFTLVDFNTNEIIELFNNFFIQRKNKFNLVNEKFNIKWYIHESNILNQDFPHGDYIILIYFKNNEHIIELFKLFGTDELFNNFFNDLMNLFR